MFRRECYLKLGKNTLESEVINLMRFSYDKLWKLLIDKKMVKKDLMEVTGVTSSTIAKMGKEQPVSLEVLGRICKALKCDIGDVVDVVFDE